MFGFEKSIDNVVSTTKKSLHKKKITVKDKFVDVSGGYSWYYIKDNDDILYSMTWTSIGRRTMIDRYNQMKIGNTYFVYACLSDGAWNIMISDKCDIENVFMGE